MTWQLINMNYINHKKRIMKKPLKIFTLLFVMITGTFNIALFTGFRNNKIEEKAPTPPMGWNSWNWFGKKKIDENVVREVIDAMSDQGLRDAGYRYVVVDGGWRASTLGAGGMLLPDTVKFPHGIK